MKRWRFKMVSEESGDTSRADGSAQDSPDGRQPISTESDLVLVPATYTLTRSPTEVVDRPKSMIAAGSRADSHRDYGHSAVPVRHPSLRRDAASGYHSTSCTPCLANRANAADRDALDLHATASTITCT